MNDDELESEEVDVQPYEGEPDFVDAPSKQSVDGGQDVADEEDEEVSDA